MKGIKFLGILFIVVLAITNSEAVLTLVLFFLVMAPTASEWLTILRAPAADVVVINAVFLALVTGLAWPVVRFINGRLTGPDQLRRFRDRAVNLPYFLGGFSALFFIIGTTAITWRSLNALGWPANTVIYGFLSGVICGMLALPLYVYSGRWLLAPVIRRSMAGEGEAAQSAGFRLSIRRKQVATVVLIVGAAAGYTGLVAYSQTRKVLDDYNTPAVVAALQASGVDAGSGSGSIAARVRRLAGFYLLLWAACVLISGVVGYAAAQEITHPVSILRQAAERLRGGHYDHPVHLVSNDEMGELAVVLNRMRETIAAQILAMGGLLRELQTGIGRIDDSARTMLAASAEAASGASQQASAVQESSAIAEQMAVSARQISEKARSVDSDAANTVSACRQGEEMLGRAQASFGEISAQAERVRATLQDLHDRFRLTYKIVEFLEEVADQTELLALNASLEAAGAGEAGRRFTVVAEEVHRLARRSAESAGSIRELIVSIQQATDLSIAVSEAGQTKVAQGGQVIGQVMTALTDIKRFAAGTSHSVREISLSTNQQSSAFDQLALSISEVREVAARVEISSREIESAIGNLKDFADSLRATVEQG